MITLDQAEDMEDEAYNRLKEAVRKYKNALVTRLHVEANEEVEA